MKGPLVLFDKLGRILHLRTHWEVVLIESQWNCNPFGLPLSLSSTPTSIFRCISETGATYNGHSVLPKSDLRLGIYVIGSNVNISHSCFIESADIPLIADFAKTITWTSEPWLQIWDSAQRE
jgi:hypothetical protein